MSRPARSTVRLSPVIHKRLSAYAVAAGAAGVGALALTPPSEAEVVYTPPDHVIVINHGHSYNLAPQSRWNHRFYVTGKIVRRNFHLLHGSFHPPRSWKWGSRLPDGAGRPMGCRAQSRCGHWPLSVLPRKNHGRDCGFCGFHLLRRSWLNVKNRYLGLSFQINGETHYGWARLNVQSAGHTLTAVLTGYAYETIANKPIIAGKTGGTEENAVSQSQPNGVSSKPATLGELAIGSPAPSMSRK